jgi:hypothetical protein
MLDRHPMLAIPPETVGLIPDLYGRRLRYGEQGRVDDMHRFLRDLSSHPGFRRWGISIEAVAEHVVRGQQLAEAIAAAYETYAIAHRKVTWADKTPRYLEYLALLGDLFPNARFVHLIRDGRDVALSELDRKRLHRRAASAGILWARKTSLARATGQSLGRDRYIELRYESLVSTPEAELRRLCEFLGLPFSESMLEHDPSVISRELTRMPVAERAWHQRLTLPPTPGLRDWRTEMSLREVAEFEAVAGRALVDAGYRLSDVNVTTTVRLRAWVHLGAFVVRTTGPRLRFRRKEKQRWRQVADV